MDAESKRVALLATTSAAFGLALMGFTIATAGANPPAKSKEVSSASTTQAPSAQASPQGAPSASGKPAASPPSGKGAGQASCGAGSCGSNGNKTK